MKQGNACGEKALARTQWERRDTSTIHRDGEWVLTKLNSITQRARREPKCKFTTLIHLLTEGFLKDCFVELKRKSSAGIDGVTYEEYEANLEQNLKDLVARMKAWKYRPSPVRRVYIPKPNGKERPLGIPIIEDKIVQMGIKSGRMDIQRFIYWNFLKCFWNERLGYDSSVMINYDWYSPSNAQRFEKEEFLKMVCENGLKIQHFHEEEACFSGRFLKQSL